MQTKSLSEKVAEAMECPLGGGFPVENTTTRTSNASNNNNVNANGSRNQGVGGGVSGGKEGMKGSAGGSGKMRDNKEVANDANYANDNDNDNDNDAGKMSLHESDSYQSEFLQMRESILFSESKAFVNKLPDWSFFDESALVSLETVAAAAAAAGTGTGTGLGLGTDTGTLTLSSEESDASNVNA